MPLNEPADSRIPFYKCTCACIKLAVHGEKGVYPAAQLGHAHGQIKNSFFVDGEEEGGGGLTIMIIYRRV